MHIILYLALLQDQKDMNSNLHQVFVNKMIWIYLHCMLVKLLIFDKNLNP